MGTFVVGSCDSFESFLAGGVPDLEFDSAAIGLEGPDLEINTDGGQETMLRECSTFR